MADHVLIIGGGLAGLAAATALAPRGIRVTVLESRNRLGGRAGSFVDVGSGQHSRRVEDPEGAGGAPYVARVV